MTRYVALLRAVNVGGTGALAMTALKAIGVGAGFARVRTYIASGNLVFDSEESSARVTAALEERLDAHMGKRVGVVLRSAGELRAVLDGNPFAAWPAKFTHAIFLDRAPPPDALDRAINQAGEEMRLGAREIYVRYPHGAGPSRLKIPAAAQGTARNMNTIARLVEMAFEA